MVKLKLMRLIPCAIAVTTLLFFFACVDKSYDWDDDNLDKNAVWSQNGFAVPLGSVESISVFEELQKQFTGEDNVIFSHDSDGTLFVQFDGDFDVDIPSIEVSEVEPVTVHADDIPIEAGLNNFPLEPPLFNPGDRIPLAKDVETYEIENNVSGDNWSIDVSSVDFASCDINITVSFTGITFDGEEPGKLLLSLQLPPGIILTDAEKIKYPGNLISEEIDIKEFIENNNEHKLSTIKVANYNYGQNTDFDCEVYLILGNDIKITTQNEFSFDLVLETENIEPSIFYGKATVEIADAINDFNTFFDSFEDDIFDFRNPAMGIEVRTNIGTKFDLDIKRLAAVNKNGVEIENIGGNAPLALEKPNPVGVNSFQDTHYWLSPLEENIPDNATHEKLAVDKLINSRPYGIKYDLELKTAANENAVFFANGMDISGKYTLKLPFDFNKLTVTIADTIRDVFTQDIYDNFFKNSKDDDYLEVIADSIDISFKEAIINLSANAVILDNSQQPIDPNKVKIEVTPETLVTANGDNKLIIKIQGLKNLEEARHLQLDFSTKSEASKLTKDDYIHIQKLRFKSSGGYHFEL